MNKIKTALLVVCILCGTVLASAADAHGRYRHRSHVGIWFGVPAPIYYPRYHYYPRYYYPPAYVAPPATYIEQSAPPATYIEQSAAPAPSQDSPAYWYFCPDSQIYYPYVQQCTSQWQQVVPRQGPPS